MNRLTVISISLICIFTFQAIKAQNNRPVLIEMHTNNVSMIMSTDVNNNLLFQYFGARINNASPFLNKNTYRRNDYGTDNFVYPTAGGRNFREPALAVSYPDGDLNTELTYISHTQETSSDGKICKTQIVLEDQKQSLYVHLTIKAHRNEDVFIESASIENKNKKAITLHNFYSSYLPIRAQKYYLNSFHGAWAQEMTLEQELLMHGIKSIESKKGVRTTHTENPSFMIALNTPLEENIGEVIAGALAWSGNYRINFQIDEFDILGITAGMNPFESEYKLKPNEVLKTPEMIYTYSNAGAGQATRNLHDWARNYGIYDAQTIRPTLLNSWEGAYFKFDEQVLKKMMDDAAEIGLEMFVLDDGWFGNEYPRDNDKTGLGDWQVNEKKLPNGIKDLADYAIQKGLKFGIWIEPEMVNPTSNLAKQHPDWIVKAKDRPVTTMRSQWMLDLTNPKVQDFVYGAFDNVMQMSPNISYIKWDANRHIESVGSTYLSANEQSHFWINYTKGLYSIYERIRAKYPNVIIQACSSGGGRVDYGALKYHQEVWTSDNTDALSRIFIQYGTNMIYPALATGAHVSASPNHQTGNQTPIKFRFDLAMSGRLGMELQPQQLTPQEKKFAQIAIRNYKEIRPLLMFGDLYRIQSPYSDKGFYSLMYSSKDKKQAVLYAFCIKYQGRTHLPLLKLYGLDPQKKYKIKEINTNKSCFWGNNQIFSGEYLINEGINPKLQKCFDSAIFLLEEAQ